MWPSLVTRLSGTRRLNLKNSTCGLTFLKYMERVSKYSFTPLRIDCPCVLIFTKIKIGVNHWNGVVLTSSVVTFYLCMFLKFLNILVIVDLSLQNAVLEALRMATTLEIHCACIPQQLDSVLQILRIFDSKVTFDLAPTCLSKD